ncbi:hypothetical protein TorRG33x02_042410, partial [Trema orientale]
MWQVYKRGRGTVPNRTEEVGNLLGISPYTNHTNRHKYKYYDEKELSWWQPGGMAERSHCHALKEKRSRREVPLCMSQLNNHYGHDHGSTTLDHLSEIKCSSDIEHSLR